MLFNLPRILQDIATNSTIPTNSTVLDLEEKRCDLFGAFSFIVQFILGVLSFMVLFIKRFMETPKRPWKVWYFDISKQIVSACSIHLMNLFIAIFLSINNKENRKSDECMWYFINLFVDTTLGVFICYALMLLINKLARQHKIKELQSGLYYENFIKNGKPGIRLKPKMYFAQLLIWVFVVTIVKINLNLFFKSKVTLLGFTKLFAYYLEIIGNFILKPFSIDEKLELFMVMIIFPLLFNAIQFWVIDNILKLPPEEIKEIAENENREDEPGVDVNALNNVESQIKTEYELKEISSKSEYVPPIQIEIIKEENLDSYSNDSKIINKLDGDTSRNESEGHNDSTLN